MELYLFSCNCSTFHSFSDSYASLNLDIKSYNIIADKQSDHLGSRRAIHWYDDTTRKSIIIPYLSLTVYSIDLERDAYKLLFYRFSKAYVIESIIR